MDQIPNSFWTAVATIVAAGVGFAGGLAVTWANHRATQRRNREDERQEFLLKAYADFVNAAARLATARRMGRTSDEEAELVALNDAKTRICIVAPIEIVSALGEFWLQGGTLELEHEILAFTRLCTAIRHSLGHDHRDAVRAEFSNILFKLEPSSYSYKVEDAQHAKAADLSG